MSRFADKVAIITGSSNGIGRTTALLLAKEGAKVTITGRNAERLEVTKQQILAAGVPEDHINSVVGDVTTDVTIDEIVNSTVQKFGKINILVNNAGAAFPHPEEQIGVNGDMNLFDLTIDLNVRSVLKLIKKSKPYLAEKKGEIVNVSSIAATPNAHPSYIYYSMAKIALEQLTRGAAIQLISDGIRVNCVCPGIVRTGFVQAMGVPAEKSEKFYQYFNEHKDCIPTEKVGEPEDIANLILFLADRKLSSYIIGQSIVIDGGTSLVLALQAHEVITTL